MAAPHAGHGRPAQRRREASRPDPAGIRQHRRPERRRQGPQRPHPGADARDPAGEPAGHRPAGAAGAGSLPVGLRCAAPAGESAQQYGAEQAVYEAQQKHAEARARLAQVEQNATSTAEDLVAPATIWPRLRSPSTRPSCGHRVGREGQRAAQPGRRADRRRLRRLKGLSGIVENITKMIAGFAAARSSVRCRAHRRARIQAGEAGPG